MTKFRFEICFSTCHCHSIRAETAEQAEEQLMAMLKNGEVDVHIGDGFYRSETKYRGVGYPNDGQFKTIEIRQHLPHALIYPNP